MVTNFGPVFHGWITAMYNDICSVVWMNDHLLVSFNIVHSVCQGCPLYVLTLEPLLQKLETLGGIVISVYIDDVTIIVSDNKHIDLVSTTVKEYEEVTVVKINPKFGGPAYQHLERKIHADQPSCTMLGSQTRKIASRRTGARVASHRKICTERRLSLKSQAEVLDVGSVIYYHITILPCPSSYLAKLEHLPFHFFWKGWIAMVRCSICCEHKMNGYTVVIDVQTSA